MAALERALLVDLGDSAVTEEAQIRGYDHLIGKHMGQIQEVHRVVPQVQMFRAVAPYAQFIGEALRSGVTRIVERPRKFNAA